jgi:hypothetical protein
LIAKTVIGRVAGNVLCIQRDGTRGTARAWEDRIELCSGSTRELRRRRQS